MSPELRRGFRRSHDTGVRVTPLFSQPPPPLPLSFFHRKPILCWDRAATTAAVSISLQRHAFSLTFGKSGRSLKADRRRETASRFGRSARFCLFFPLGDQEARILLHSCRAQGRDAPEEPLVPPEARSRDLPAASRGPGRKLPKRCARGELEPKRATGWIHPLSPPRHSGPPCSCSQGWATTAASSKRIPKPFARSAVSKVT